MTLNRVLPYCKFTVKTHLNKTEILTIIKSNTEVTHSFILPFTANKKDKLYESIISTNSFTLRRNRMYFNNGGFPISVCSVKGYSDNCEINVLTRLTILQLFLSSLFVFPIIGLTIYSLCSTWTKFTFFTLILCLFLLTIIYLIFFKNVHTESRKARQFLERLINDN